jgi:hypothetical protein
MSEKTFIIDKLRSYEMRWKEDYLSEWQFEIYNALYLPRVVSNQGHSIFLGQINSRYYVQKESRNSTHHRSRPHRHLESLRMSYQV